MSKELQFKVIGFMVMGLILAGIFSLFIVVFPPTVPDTIKSQLFVAQLTQTPPGRPTQVSPQASAQATAGLTLDSVAENNQKETWIEIGNPQEYAKAEILVNNLEKRKYEPEMQEVQMDNKTLYRVVIGPLSDRDKDKILKQLQKHKFRDVHFIYR